MESSGPDGNNGCATQRSVDADYAERNRDEVDICKLPGRPAPDFGSRQLGNKTGNSFPLLKPMRVPTDGFVGYAGELCHIPRRWATDDDKERAVC